MIRLVLVLVLWTMLGILAAWLADSGSLRLGWQGYEIEVHVGLAVGALLALIGVAVLLFEAWRWLVGLPGRHRRQRRMQRQIDGYRELAYGMVAAAAGDAVAASMHAKRAGRMIEEEAATLLLAAQTAQLEGKDDVAQLKFKAMLEEPATRFLGMRGLLADAVRRGAWEEALELAREAHRLRPSTPWVLTTLFDLLTRAELWSEALQVVGELGRQRLFHKDELARRRALLNHMQALDAIDGGNLDDAASYARIAVRLQPDFTPAAVLAATVARHTGRDAQARRILEAAWQTGPHPDLANAYAMLDGEETPAARLERFGRLERLQPDEPLTHVVLAELAITAERWEEARAHLERALELRPTAGVYRLYADYERASGHGDERARSWLTKTLDAEPDKAWVCEDSGEVLAEWQLYGPTGRFDSVHWESPPKVARLAAGQRPAYALPHEPATGSGTARDNPLARLKTDPDDNLPSGV